MGTSQEVEEAEDEDEKKEQSEDCGQRRGEETEVLDARASPEGEPHAGIDTLRSAVCVIILPLAFMRNSRSGR